MLELALVLENATPCGYSPYSLVASYTSAFAVQFFNWFVTIVRELVFFNIKICLSIQD